MGRRVKGGLAALGEGLGFEGGWAVGVLVYGPEG